MKTTCFNRTAVLLILTICMVMWSVSGVAAGSFPSREIKIIVPWSPGGSTDIMARKMQPIFKKMGIDVVVVDKPGAASAVGLTEVISSKPDGYTVGFASSTILSLIGQGQIKWGIDRFENIALISEDPYLLVTGAKAKWKGIDDFMADIKANPGSITIGTPGSKNVPHAVAKLTAMAAGGEIRQVPFKGGAKVISNIMGGHVMAGALKPSETMHHFKAGSLRPLVINRHSRLDVLPDTPTYKEKGYNILVYGPVNQVTFAMVPAGVKPEVKAKLSEMFKKVCLSDDFQKLAKTTGFVCDPITGKELDTFITDLSGSLAQVAKKIF